MQQKVVLVGSLNASKIIAHFNNLKEVLGLSLVLQSFGYELEGALSMTVGVQAHGVGVVKCQACLHVFFSCH